MNIIITGATSGIGKELALQFAAKGNKVGLIGRRTERLEELKHEIGELAYIRTLDVTNFERAEKVYQELIDEMDGLDIMILNAGVGRIKTRPAWRIDESIIEVNAFAFAHGCHFAFEYFLKQGYGQIVGMSSIAAHIASGRAAAYTASKHFISNYMTGFRQKANLTGADITITDLKPGYIWTEMTERNNNMFWVSSVQKAVQQMVRAIEKKKNHAYITKRWRLLAWAAELVPQWIWDRLKV
ncbi:MAG: SDR family NAD(P)-dependent oxidoreductase [Balneolaceae bacterium]|nr:SDR family NAD(P)-dependent oxidoreductase [Balneolaceae bacterium]